MNTDRCVVYAPMEEIMKANMLRKRYLQIAGIVVGIAGLVIVAVQSSVLLAFGIFLLLWGNNLERQFR
jgi:hypothetical protein